MKNAYTLYWRTGDREIVYGNAPHEAMMLAGYGGGAVRALDFYMNGDCNDYRWNKETRTWEKKEP